MIAAGLALAVAASLVGGACETPLAWDCSGIQGQCRCIITAASDVGQGGEGTLVGDCDTSVAPKASCCYLVDTTNNLPAICTCSAEACTGKQANTDNCSALARYF